jgi:hypothetical protein
MKDLASLPGWDGVPILTAIAECPVYSAAGELVDRPGYHAGARLWYQPTAGLNIPPVPLRPTRQQIVDATALLLNDLFADFPFRDEASRAHALAALVLPFVRQMIDGPTPLHLFDAPVEGTGKGLLASCATIVATGREAAPMTEAGNDEEWRKRITATLAEGPTFVLLDNLSRILDTGALASVLTSTVWKDRLLGISKNATLPNLAVWMATANNARLSRELLRRTVWCRLDAQVDAPWERSGFRHPNLRQWARENRGRLIAAVLVLCQAWVAAGRPKGKESLGSFESWAQVLGGILEVAGVPGLLANARDFRETVTDRDSEWRSFVTVWWETHQGGSVGADQLYALATTQKLLDSVLGDKSERSQRTRLGHQLSRVVDRVYGGWRIERAGKDNSNRQIYKLVPIRAIGTPTTAATPGAEDEDAEWQR